MPSLGNFYNKNDSNIWRKSKNICSIKPETVQRNFFENRMVNPSNDGVIY